jgi:hypothetical protein
VLQKDLTTFERMRGGREWVMKPSNSSNRGCTCYLLFLCISTIAVGIFIQNSGAPFEALLIVYGLGLLWLVATIGAAAGKLGPTTFVTSFGIDPLEIARSQEGTKDKVIYQVPPVCPGCGASISQEEVDWVGPLQAKCPYCRNTIEVEKKSL